MLALGMAAFDIRAPGSRERLVALLDRFRASFGSLSTLALGLGLVTGLALPEIDAWLRAEVPLFDFSSEEAARSMLETIATVMVSVAGIAFSVTIVAFTLSTNQLSPRVLRSFRRDLISQLTLAAFLGTFVYCLALLARLGSIAGRVPSISIAFAVLLALGSLGLFAIFIGHIANMLQPSSVISSIAEDARPQLERPFPTGAGHEPDDPAAALDAAERTMRETPGHPVRCEAEGYLELVRAGEILGAAERAGGFVRQRLRIGDYVLPGQELAAVWLPAGSDAERLVSRVGDCFEVARQRTQPQDPGFPVRQLADVALRGLSPGINDPTTALNAMEAMTAGLLRFADGRRPSPIRVDGEGEPRLLCEVPDLDELVELGFEQVVAYGHEDPVVRRRLRQLLEGLRRAMPAGEGRRTERILADGRLQGRQA